MEERCSVHICKPVWCRWCLNVDHVRTFYFLRKPAPGRRHVIFCKLLFGFVAKYYKIRVY